MGMPSGGVRAGQRQRRFHSATTSPADAQAATAEYRPGQEQKQA